MPFLGPLFTDTVGSTPGTPLDAANLNALLVAQQSYLIDGGIASSASGLTITQPALQAVINSGVACTYINLVATTITCGAGTTAKDNYVDVTDGGIYTVTTVPANTNPGLPANNALRLYVATTNSNNTAVVHFGTLANMSPLAPNGLLLPDGSNAAATFSLSGNLVVNGTATMNNDTVLNGILRSSGSTPAVTAVLGAAAGTGPAGLTVTGTANWGQVTFTTGTSPVTGTVVTFSCTPGGSQTLLGVLVNGNLNSGGSTRYISQNPVVHSGGTFSVDITVSGTALAASTSYTIVYMLVWG